MKFKAQLNRNNVRAFRGLIQSLEKVATTCVLRFSPTEMKFATVSGISDTRAFAKIPHLNSEGEDGEESSMVFVSMTVESRADNHIWIELELQTLLRGLKSTTGVSSQGLTMKLVKKSGLKCLTLTMKNVDAVVTQDVPIRTLTPNEGARHMREPEEVSMDVELRMPSLKTVKLVTDRMKSVDRFITLDTKVASIADGGSSMILRVGTTQASVKTYFRNLETSSSIVQDMKRARVKLDIKKFSKLLWVHHVYPKDAWLLISESSMIILYVILDDSRTSILYYLPVLSGGDDDEEEEEEEEEKDDEEN